MSVGYGLCVPSVCACVTFMFHVGDVYRLNILGVFGVTVLYMR